MNIVKKYTIKTSAGVVFAKVDIKNFLKRDNYEFIDFLVFVLMELSTNLLKYTDGGSIWLLREDNKYALVSLDKGKGIENLSSALMSGYTTADNSLGLGLYQIANNSFFNMQIYTQTKLSDSGTVVLVSQKGIDENVVYFTKTYMDLEQNGDYFQNKGNYFLFGDVSGHGVKAQKSAVKIKKFFLDKFVSFSLVKSFFQDLEKYLKRHHLRSTVSAIAEKNSNKIEVTGVGNLNIWIQESDTFHLKTFRDGIVGEVFDEVTTHSFELYKQQKLIFTTDGLTTRDTSEFLSALKHNYSPIMLNLCMLHFLSSELDDNSILIFEEI